MATLYGFLSALTPLLMMLAGLAYGNALGRPQGQTRHERCLANIERLERELGMD
jgi:hypothetical protein